MLRIHALAVAGLAVVGVVLGGAVARADSTGYVYRGDWDVGAPMTKTMPRQSDESLAGQFFHVEWTVATGRPGHSRITGYVYNDYGQPAVNVQLQVSEVDATGRDVASVIRPVGDMVPANGRAYFDLRVPDSRSYRVSVSSFDFVEFPGKG